MNKSLASRLSDLEASRSCHQRGCAAAVEKLLVALKSARFGDAESLIRFHDALLFLRAFPQSRKVIQLTETLLAGIRTASRKTSRFRRRHGLCSIRSSSPASLALSSATASLTRSRAGWYNATRRKLASIGTSTSKADSWVSACLAFCRCWPTTRWWKPTHRIWIGWELRPVERSKSCRGCCGASMICH